ncbi:Indoleamine 2,3-dioxygenase [Fistulina hepatica ATCC 64428]|nr:Indoleamine 2,3-dioxygenase [Fistulina hepatica ATCC 64428]
MLNFIITSLTAGLPLSFILYSAFRSIINFLRSCSLNVTVRRPLKSFDIDAETGFLPPHQLSDLPCDFQIWEEALSDANNGALGLGRNPSGDDLDKREFGELWRAHVKSWPVLSVQSIDNDVRLLQRAHLVLAWLVHYYIHSCPDSDSVVVPKSLAVPLVEVSRRLGIAPVLTYADTVLWNWTLINPGGPMSVENIGFRHTFTTTEDEASFYATSLRVELCGAEIIKIIDDCTSFPCHPDLASISCLARYLTRLRAAINDLRDIIESVRVGCDPLVFHWRIRPWFKGSDADGPTTSRWVYEGVDGDEPLDLSGPSSGQSTVIHALDAFLGVDHELKYRRSPAPSESNRKADHGFMRRMQRYMPQPHREYLHCISQNAVHIREAALKFPMLREPYDGAIAALKRLRDLHIRVAVLYIVSMAHSIPPGCPASTAFRKMEAAGSHGPARGTGGNEISVLLKAGRDATLRTMINAR